MGDFSQEKQKIQQLIKDFKQKEWAIIFLEHIDEHELSPIGVGNVGSEIDSDLKKDAHHVIEKRTPSAFFKTELNKLLQSLKVDHVFITGFNTEFCPQFTAISAFDRGYQVTFIEDATATVNDDKVYELQGLDIGEFVGSVLHWSSVIDVLYFAEYVDEYMK